MPRKVVRKKTASGAKVKQVSRKGEVTKTVTRRKGSGAAAVDGESYGTKGRTVTKSTPKRTVTKTKSKGTGWANPIKKISTRKLQKTE